MRKCVCANSCFDTKLNCIAVAPNWRKWEKYSMKSVKQDDPIGYKRKMLVQLTLIMVNID